MSRIICISREYGSGGHEAAEKAASILNIPCVDKQLMEHTISMSGLPEELLKEAEEKTTNPFLYTSVYHGDNREFYGKSPGDIVFELEKRQILKYAERSDCIIVGRCAEEILKTSGHLVVSVFITAPFDYRVKRKQRESGMDTRKTEQLVRRVDKQRKAYYEYHNGKDWGQPYNYDVCLNSASMGIDRIAAVIAESFGKIMKGAEDK